MSNRLPKPEWLKIRLKADRRFQEVNRSLKKGNLTTVCTEANCPNQGECWGQYRTATFMVLGEICTRKCKFCSVTTGRPADPDLQEPRQIAEAVSELKLKHAVITMVTRDDLPDGGAEHLAKTVREIRKLSPDCSIEVLSSDFRGNKESIQALCESAPEVISHNVETVERLKGEISSGTSYRRSLEVLKVMKKQSPTSLLKSSLIIGMGESAKEIEQAMDDLRSAGVAVLNIGQYLQPSRESLPVKKYWHPDEFESFRKLAMGKGFSYCESGPFVRSSYHAGKHYESYKNIRCGNDSV